MTTRRAAAHRALAILAARCLAARTGLVSALAAMLMFGAVLAAATLDELAAPLEGVNRLRRSVALIVVVSIVVHSSTAVAVARWLEHNGKPRPAPAEENGRDGSDAVHRRR